MNFAINCQKWYGLVQFQMIDHPVVTDLICDWLLKGTIWKSVDSNLQHEIHVHEVGSMRSWFFEFLAFEKITLFPSFICWLCQILGKLLYLVFVSHLLKEANQVGSGENGKTGISCTHLAFSFAEIINYHSIQRSAW